MKATRFEFRFRLAIVVLIYGLGFTLPWLIHRAGGPHETTTWLALSGAMARTGALSVQSAIVGVTSLAIVLAATGAVLRVWGTAYIGTGIMTSGEMHAQSVLAAGPYRHVRNPLYLGSLALSCAVAILMGPIGAIFFLVAMFVHYLRLILGEEAYLTEQQGETYLAYKTRVPRFVFSLTPRVPEPVANPRWVRAVAAEIYPLGIALSFAVLAWRYNVDLLIKAVIICFGLSLIVRAFLAEKAE
ncbi:MAG TPA: isoprenylcysteine carboxylmethyltransferase family protein [Silvibacterium sp.]|nr:isoprenylcysteine carboxylmethyltransferase family protein [Silvibacterium sp.]